MFHKNKDVVKDLENPVMDDSTVHVKVGENF